MGLSECLMLERCFKSFVLPNACAMHSPVNAALLCSLVPCSGCHSGRSSFCPSLEVRALRRLRQLLVGRRRHVSPYLDENGLHGEVALPDANAWELREVDLPLGSQYMLKWRSMESKCTFPVRWSTQGRLTLLMKVTSGGESG